MLEDAARHIQLKKLKKRCYKTNQKYDDELNEKDLTEVLNFLKLQE